MARHARRERPPFAELIRAARRELGWSQDDLIERSKIARATLKRWEAGDDSTPNADIVLDVVDTLGVDRYTAFVALGWLPDPGEEAEPPAPQLTSSEKIDRGMRMVDEGKRLMDEGLAELGISSPSDMVG